MPTAKDWSKFVGFYGCGKPRATRVVRVGMHASPLKQGNWMKKYPKQVHELDCPACGDTHVVSVMWRAPNDGEMDRIEVDLTEALAPPSPKGKRNGTPRDV